MPQNIDYSDVSHVGQHTFEKAPAVPANSFGDAQIGTINPIQAIKLKHQYVPVYAQPHGVAAVTERKVVHVARSAGDVQAIEAGIVVAAAGAATVTVDLRKNGTTILSSVITLDNANVAYAEEAGTISSAPYVAGDVFELVVVATAGGGTLPQGLYVDTVFREGSG